MRTRCEMAGKSESDHHHHHRYDIVLKLLSVDAEWDYKRESIRTLRAS